MSEKRYWLHRVANHCNGLEILKKENRLTIGFADVAVSENARKALADRDWLAFCTAYTQVYGGEIERLKGGLWRFVCEMQQGDTVIVPYWGGFYICNVLGPAVVSNRSDVDIGYEREIEILAAGCEPREGYASQKLLSRMKCRQTNLEIGDLAKDVEDALARRIANTPYDLCGDIGKVLRKELQEHISPERFEDVVAAYFKALRANVKCLAKNYAEKCGDCDLEAIFPELHLTVSVQCKKHFGLTDDWAVRQINDYAKKRKEDNDHAKEQEAENEDSNWTYANWVVSLADDFTKEAYELAHENNVILINGEVFCNMLVNVGLKEF